MDFGRPFWIGLMVGAVLTAVGFTGINVLRHERTPAAGTASLLPASAPSSPPEADLSGLSNEIRSALSISVDGGNYDPTALARDAARIISMGFGRAEAVAAIKQFASASVAPSMMDDMSFTVATLAKVSASDLGIMTQKIVNGVTRGYDACDDLDRELNFLTVDQQGQIRAEFDAEKADEGRMSCFNALHARALHAANSVR